MNEATQRIEKDKSDHFPVIIMAGTSSGDANVLDRDVKRIFERIQKKPTTVHVVLLNSTTGSASGGANQTQVGMAVTEATRGRYESIAAATRLATLLPEIGKQVAASHEKQSHQFRLTVERPGRRQGRCGPGGGGRARRTPGKGIIDGRTSRTNQPPNPTPNYQAIRSSDALRDCDIWRLGVKSVERSSERHLGTE